MNICDVPLMPTGTSARTLPGVIVSGMEFASLRAQSAARAPTESGRKNTATAAIMTMRIEAPAKRAQV